MNCKNCEELMELEEYTIDFHDDKTLILTEHYWCHNCGKLYERIATYELAREWMEEEEEKEDE